jgi:hypothetical protein
MEKDMKMKNLKLIMAASIGFSGIGLAAQPVSATPMNGLDPAIATSTDTSKERRNDSLGLWPLALPLGSWPAVLRVGPSLRLLAPTTLVGLQLWLLPPVAPVGTRRG